MPPRKRKTEKPVPVCKVGGCTATKAYTRGLCALHWCTRADLADPVPPITRPGKQSVGGTRTMLASGR